MQKYVIALYMRVFTSEKKINYPSYILKAIGIDSENVGDRDE